MNFIYTFKFYENIVVNDKKELYQLTHVKNKRTLPFKKLTYNEHRKAYRIYSQWVSKKRLYKLIKPCNLFVEDKLNHFEQMLKKILLKIKNDN
jgi:hypothetical protein